MVWKAILFIIVIGTISNVLTQWTVVRKTVGEKAHLDRKPKFGILRSKRADVNLTYWEIDDYPLLPRGKQACAGNRSFLGNVERICDPDSILRDWEALTLEESLTRFYTDRYNHSFCLCPILEPGRCSGYFVLSPLIALAKNIAHRYDFLYERVIHEFAKDYDSATRASEANQFCGNTLTIFISFYDRELAFVYGKRFFQVIDGFYERIFRVKMVRKLDQQNLQSDVFWALHDYFEDLYAVIVNFDFSRAEQVIRDNPDWFGPNP